MLNDFISEQNIDLYVQSFNFMTADELSAFIVQHELSLSLEELIYLQNYFKSNVSCFPTYNQLNFFNELSKKRKAQKNDYSIYSATATEGAETILESSKDLLSKRSLLKKKSVGAMPISYAAQISAEYLNQAGFSNDSYFLPAEEYPNAEYYIHTSDDIPLFAYHDPTKKVTVSSNTTLGNNCFVMLCPLYEMYDFEYATRCNDFLSLSNVKSLIAEQATISEPYGLYDILIKETNGIFVNLSNIPETKKNEVGKTVHLTSLLSCYNGRRIFTVNNMSLGFIIQLASQYSLGVYIFATRNYSKKFTLEAIKNPVFSFEFAFLNGLSGLKEHRPYTFEGENDSPIGTKKSIYLTSQRGMEKQTYRADRVINFGKTVASATSRDLSSAPHKTASLAVIDAANALIAKGVAKSSITLSVDYSLLGGTEDPLELGKNLSAILGVYRSTIELCIPQTKPRISYNKRKRNITVIASAKAPRRPIESAFKNGDTKIYFLPIYFSENGLPDYEKYRNSVSRFYGEIEKDNVLSAFAINENLLPTIKSAAKSTDFIFYDAHFQERFGENACSSIHGILFESYEALSCDEGMFLLGETVKKENAE